MSLTRAHCGLYTVNSIILYFLVFFTSFPLSCRMERQLSFWRHRRATRSYCCTSSTTTSVLHRKRTTWALTSQPPHLRLCVLCKPVLCYMLCLLACACVCVCVQISRSALSHACEHGHLAIVRLMVRAFGCSVGERTKVSKDSRVYSLHRLMSMHMFCIDWMDSCACRS